MNKLSGYAPLAVTLIALVSGFFSQEFPAHTADFRITSIQLTNNNNVRLSWDAPGGSNYVVQRTYSLQPGMKNFEDVSPPIYVPIDQSTNYTHTGGFNNATSSFYRVRSFSGIQQLRIEPTNAIVAPGMTNRYKVMAVYPDNSFRDVTGAATMTALDAGVAQVVGTDQGFTFVSAISLGTSLVRAVYQGQTNLVNLRVLQLTGMSINPPFSLRADVKGQAQSLQVFGTFAGGETYNITPASVLGGGAAPITQIEYKIQADVANSFALLTGQSAADDDIMFTAAQFETDPLRVRWCKFERISLMPRFATLKPGETQQFTVFGHVADGSVVTLGPNEVSIFSFDSFIARTDFSTLTVTGVNLGGPVRIEFAVSNGAAECGTFYEAANVVVDCPGADQVDNSFHSYGIANNPQFTAIGAIAVQSDDRAIIGGNFTDYDGFNWRYLARLDANGFLDTGFPSSAAPNGTVHSILLQPDGKVIIAGEFSRMGTVSRTNVARLNINGTLDTTFVPAPIFSSGFALARQTNGQVLVGGFVSRNGSRSGIMRLNTNGTIDNTFNTGEGAEGGSVRSIMVQPDGKILIGGLFSHFNGVERLHIARLDSLGNLDTTFDPGMGAIGGSVRSIVALPDNKLLIGGLFTNYNGTTRSGFARINSNGTLDQMFDPGPGVGGTNFPAVYRIVVQENGKIVVGGNFTTAGGRYQPGVARFNAEGSFDGDFLPPCETGIPPPIVYSMALRNRSTFYVGGDFRRLAGAQRGGIVRLFTGE